MAGNNGFIKTIFHKVLEILYPSDCICICCGRETHVSNKGLCDACRNSLVPCAPYKIPKHLDGCFSAYVYECPIKYAVHGLKYNRKTYLAAELAGHIVIPPEWHIDSIIPVPLHKKRQRKRGFNQCELIAKSISERTGIPIDYSVLKRIKNTVTQTALTGDTRRRNMDKAFTCTSACDGKRILLVDDVITTGTTLSACAETLKNNGAALVFAVTVASAM